MTSAKMTWKKWTIIASLFTAITLVCLPAAGQTKSSTAMLPTQNVVVVNGPGQPVPTAAQGTTNVAGTVNVGNSPSVNVANTPTVNLAAGGSVNVTNPPNGQNNPTPLAVLEATQPYEDTCSIGIGVNSYAGSCNFHAIPSGKRLVIQEFDGLAGVETGLKPVEIRAGGSLDHFFTAISTGSLYGGDTFVTHQETHLYVAANTTPHCSVQLSGNTSNGALFVCNISGFLVDVP